MKKGYTLIEIIVTLSIIAILTSVISLGANYYKKTTDKIKNEAILAEVKVFLSFSKAYSRKRNVVTKIYIDENGKFMTINEGLNRIKIIEFNSGFSIGSSFTNTDIEINSQGFITKSGSFFVYKNYNEIGKVTVSVGNDIIRMYENDKEEVDIIE